MIYPYLPSEYGATDRQIQRQWRTKFADELLLTVIE